MTKDAGGSVRRPPAPLVEPPRYVDATVSRGLARVLVVLFVLELVAGVVGVLWLASHP